MSKSDGENGTPDHGEIQTWLLAKLGEELKLDPGSIDVRAPFSHYGLDSMAAVSLVGQLETWLGRELSPTLPYDYPNVNSLAAHLSGAGDPA